jgi:hypothetical protein
MDPFLFSGPWSVANSPYQTADDFWSQFLKGDSLMEPRKEDLQQTPQSRPEEKKRRFRLVKLEEQRFRMDKLEDRLAPGTHHCHPSTPTLGLCPTSAGHSSIE